MRPLFCATITARSGDSRNYRVRRLFPLLLGLIVLTVCIRGHASGQTTVDVSRKAYSEGVAAFEAGDYQRARAAFLRARATGYIDPRLGYSLGATYYHLGQYVLAQREFSALLEEPQLTALCHYNLGLIANKLHEPELARREFQIASGGASDAGLRRLASDELVRLAPPTARASRWFAYADLTGGYDDNVALAPQTGLVAASGRGSPLLSVLAGGNGQISGSYADGTQVFGSYYQTDYSSLPQYNQTMLNLGAQYRYASPQWSARVAVSGGKVTFGGASLERLTTLRFEAGRELAVHNRVVAGYQYQWVTAASNYDYLSGWQQQLFVEDQAATPGFSAMFGYQHEVNRRNDLTTGTEFFSDSPARNALYARLKLHHTDKLDFYLDARYEKSLYPDPDILTGTSGVTTIRRNDTQYTFDVGSQYQLTTTWQLDAGYRYLKNTSNIGFYAYQSNRFSLSFKYLFY